VGTLKKLVLKRKGRNAIIAGKGLTPGRGWTKTFKGSYPPLASTRVNLKREKTELNPQEGATMVARREKSWACVIKWKSTKNARGLVPLH